MAQVQQDFCCGICLGVFVDPVSFQCGHNFCMACARNWLTQCAAHPRCSTCSSSAQRSLPPVNITLRNIVEAQYPEQVACRRAENEEDSVEEKKDRVVVLDIGSSMCKIGFSGEDAPRSLFPSMVALPRMPLIMGSTDGQDFRVGNAIQARRGISNLVYPIHRNVVEDWDSMEKIWHHAFYTELNVDPKKCPVLMTEAPFNPKANRERMVRMMFEVFEVPAAYVAIAAVLSMYACGRTSGVAVDIGHGVTHGVPMFEGYPIVHAIWRSPLAGYDLTENLNEIMSERGYYPSECAFARHPLQTTAGLETVRDMKERLCFVSQDFDRDIRACSLNDELVRSYQKPDGGMFTIGSERFRCTEVLFKPEFIGKCSVGIHKMICQSILTCDEDLHACLLENIVLSGGTASCTGLAERLKKELSMLVSDRMNVNVTLHPDAVFKGGAILASLPTFRGMCITREDYDESGPTVVHRKCF